MPRTPAWRRYLRFWRPDVDADVDDELHFHLEMRTEELVARGWGTEAARAQALAEFGDVATVRTALREIDHRLAERRGHMEWLDALARDLRFAVRRLRRQPGFAVPAAATLGLGIGATAAIFALVHAVLLRPLPYHEPDRLVAVHHVAPGFGLTDGGLSDGTYAHYRARNRAFDEMGSYFDRVLSVTDGDTPERLRAALVTPSVFAVLRARPARGRLCHDPAPVDPIEVVLSHDLWVRRFGADPAVVGGTIELNRVPRAVVGVMPRGFDFPHRDTQLWFCMPVDTAEAQLRSFHQTGIARLRAGVSPERARAELQRLVPLLADAYPDVTPELLEEAKLTAVVVPLKDAMLRDVRPALVLLLCTAALVLLISWANVANLFLVRAEHRRREIAIARALGASTRDLARRLLAESTTLAAAGGALGLALAWMGVAARFGFEPGGIPRLHEVRVDGMVVGATAALSLLAGLLLGAVSLARADIAEPARALSRSGIRGTPSRAWRRAQRSLVAVQVMLALALLVASAAMVESVWRMRQLRLGFDPSDLVVFEVALPFRQYERYHEGAYFFHELTRRLRAVPGVTAAEAAGSVPLTPVSFVTESVAPVDAAGRPEDESAATGNAVTPGYFRTMGIPLLHGRGFRAGDLLSAETPVVVGAALARALWGDGDVVGRRLTLGRHQRPAPFTVVGVVGDVPGETIAGGQARMLYFPILEDLAGIPDARPAVPYYPGELIIVVRTTLSPAEVLGAARRIVGELDAKVPVANLRTMEQLVARAMARTRLTAILLVIAAGTALLLGAIGVYGVVSYTVMQRIPEFGIRLALGAAPSGLRRMVLRQEGIVVAAGIAGGTLLAVATMRLVRGLLFQVSPTDPVLFAATAALVASVALVACWLPARRASRVDPVEALRAD
jgi:predicted permease